MKNGILLIVCILFPLIVGAVSGFFTSESIYTWYIFLNKPSFNPPNYLFGPVWTTLYFLMGISFYMIVRKSTAKSSLVFIFFIQLSLNFLWSFIFFKFHLLGYALIEIIMLWISILLMIVLFYKENKIAGLLNIPYLLWVTFASILNYSLYSLN